MSLSNLVTRVVVKAGRMTSFSRVRCLGVLAPSSGIKDTEPGMNAILKSHTPLISNVIDPVSINKPSYITPTVESNFVKFIFGGPFSVPPEIREPGPLKATVLDPNASNNTKIEAHKRDKYWRRRGMKHHIHMRWRKRNETMLAYRDLLRQEKKVRQRQEEIENIWKGAGLEMEPPKLSSEELETKVSKWKEQGIWTEALTPQEMFKYGTPPEPLSKKTLPSHHILVPK